MVRDSPPLRSFMDDITSLLPTAPCTARLLRRMDELMSWARMKVKSAKSRSLSLRKGVRSDYTIFTVGRERIPLLADQPIKSLGRYYTAELSDKQAGKAVMKQLTDGLSRIDQCQLPGKRKAWCYHTILFQRIMWPLKLCEIPMSMVNKLDGKTNSFIRKWLGLSRCLSETGLFGRNMLQLPLQSITMGYKQEKARLVMEMKESTDQSVRDVNIKIRSGHKWKAHAEVDQAISRLQLKEITGRVQAGRAGLGHGEVPKFWSKASRKERKELVVAEVRNIENERQKIKALPQGRQGNWMTWESVVGRNISLADLWKIPLARLSFLIRATYDTLPCPRNLCLWFGKEECCSLCNTPSASLQHILSGCKTALSQGRYRWRHDQVLRRLAEILERQRQEVSRGHSAPAVRYIQFVQEGGGGTSTTPRVPHRPNLLTQECSMRVDLDRKLQFPTEITAQACAQTS